MPRIPCACGCGTLIPPITKAGVPASHVAGHHRPGLGKAPWNKGTRSGPAPRERIEAKRRAGPQIPCGCGCGTLIPATTAAGQAARYAPHHQPRNPVSLFKPGHPSWNKGQPHPAASEKQRGRPKTDEQRAKLSAAVQARLAANGGRWHVKGYAMDPAKRAALSASNSARLKGKPNPKASAALRGRSLAPETIVKISGPNNHGWQGGVAVLPYGPEFTRRFKRLIRDRDGHRCRRCGKTREQEGRTLHVHHVDHVKTNNDPTNLLTVCNSCNVWLSHHRHEPFTPLPIA